MIIRLPTERSFAQRGTSPQRSASRCRAPVSGWQRTTSPSCVGARFQFGARFGVAFAVDHHGALGAAQAIKVAKPSQKIVVGGFASGELAAIRVADGRVAWSETLASARGGGLSDIAAIAAMPVIDRGRVFATGLGGLTVAIDLRSGRRLWEREVGAVETPWSAGDALFLSFYPASYVALILLVALVMAGVVAAMKGFKTDEGMELGDAIIKKIKDAVNKVQF